MNITGTLYCFDPVLTLGRYLLSPYPTLISETGLSFCFEESSDSDDVSAAGGGWSTSVWRMRYASICPIRNWPPRQHLGHFMRYAVICSIPYRCPRQRLGYEFCLNLLDS